MKLSFKNHRVSGSIILKAIRLYVKYKLSLRDVSELLLELGVNISKESVRRWGSKFCPKTTKVLRKKHKQFGRKWFLDEVYIKIENKWRYVYRW